MATQTKKKKTPKPFTRMESFLIQLATVVVGIAITFGGSSLIQKRVERKKIHELLAVVRQEIEYNVGVVRAQKGFFLDENRMADALEPYMREPEKVPTDTIDKYFDQILITINTPTLTSSLDMLKNAPGVEMVRNEDLLREIFELYEYMQNMYNDNAAFLKVKDESWNEMYAGLDIETEKELYDDQVAGKYGSSFVYFMENSPSMRRYLNAAKTGGWLSGDLLLRPDKAIKNAREIIEMIDNEVGTPTAN